MAIETVPLRLFVLLMLLNLKKLVKFTCNITDMGTKYYQKQPIFSKVGCWVLIRKYKIRSQSSLKDFFFSIFACCAYFLCSFNVFHFHMISFA